MGSMVTVSSMDVDDIFFSDKAADSCVSSIIGGVKRCSNRKIAIKASHGDAYGSADKMSLGVDFIFGLSVSDTCGTKYSAVEKCENLHLLSPYC